MEDFETTARSLEPQVRPALRRKYGKDLRTYFRQLGKFYDEWYDAPTWEACSRVCVKWLRKAKV
ncbi:MAG: hypothetical protein K8L99_04855 [Anaerolineae bacterium]|nr:hypothetical protein [Anaerolineae bacterium]